MNASDWTTPSPGINRHHSQWSKTIRALKSLSRGRIIFPAMSPEVSAAVNSWREI